MDTGVSVRRPVQSSGSKMMLAWTEGVIVEMERRKQLDDLGVKGGTGRDIKDNCLVSGRW